VTLAVEERRVRSLFERVETVEGVAGTLAADDERRATLLAVSNSALSEEATIRPVIAARLLGVSEKTIRAWAADGVLRVAARKPRLLLDVHAVHVISHILRDLRTRGRDRHLLEEVWRRLSDDAQSRPARCSASSSVSHQEQSLRARPPTTFGGCASTTSSSASRTPTAARSPTPGCGTPCCSLAPMAESFAQALGMSADAGRVLGASTEVIATPRAAQQIDGLHRNSGSA
jgi:DNA-binding transcriptional regulator YdaS (Cro superfamily)